MVKKNKTKETVVESIPTLQEYFTKYSNVSLRKLALTTGISYGVLLTASKRPIDNIPYNPEDTNWYAIETILFNKGINYWELNWEEMNKGAQRKGSTLLKDMDAFKVGDLVYLRKNNDTPYEILYKTETHIVIMLRGTSQPQSLAHGTFLINGPVFEPRAVKN